MTVQQGSNNSIGMVPVNGLRIQEDTNGNGIEADEPVTNTVHLRQTPQQEEVIIESNVSYIPDVKEDDWSDDDDYDSPDNEDKKLNIVAKVVVTIQRWTRWATTLLTKLTGGYHFFVIFLLSYIAYFITAMCYEFGSESSYRLLVCTVVGSLILTRRLIAIGCKFIVRTIYGSNKLKIEHEPLYKKFKFFSRWLLYGAIVASIVLLLIDEGRHKPKNMRSLPGLLVFLLIPLLFSTRPDKIKWHTIIWSVGLLFLSAAFVLKWKYGKESIEWLQDRVNEYFANADVASAFLFGQSWQEHPLIFGALPILFFSNATLAILYYLGVMGFIIKYIGKALNWFLDATPVEATCVSAGIFLEGVSTILLVGPFLKRMTKSQMFVVLTCTLSSLGGAYVAVLASLGVSLEYVIAAMLVSAPATFVVCKLMVPETKNINDSEEEIDVCAQEKSRYVNIIDAAQTGATSVLTAVGNVAVIAFVFYCFITFINHTLGWFGDRVGVDDLSVEYIASYLLYPVSLAMGIEPEDCRRVATLLGYRISVINLIAFIELAGMKFNKFKYLQYMAATNGTGPVIEKDMDIILIGWNETLKHGFISERSEAIVTYSLCGLSSFMSLAMNLGILFTLLPKRKTWLAKVALPALIAGNLANCMTGCFASIFY